MCEEPVKGGAAFLLCEQSPEAELNMLKAEAKALKDNLEMINRRITEMEKTSE